MRTPRTASLLALLALGLISGRAAAHFPHDVVRVFELSPTFAEDGVILAAIDLTEHQMLARSADGGKSWLQTGPIAAQKRIRGLVFSPGWPEDSTVFAATWRGGVYKSVDGGVEWVAVNDGLTSHHVFAITCSADFVEDGVVVASTLHGLFRSADAGSSWTPCRTGVKDHQLTVLGTAAGNGWMFAGGRHLLQSRDAGETWGAVKQFRSRVGGLAISPRFAEDFTLAVCFDDQDTGVMHSTDAGAEWLEMNEGLAPDSHVNDVAIADDGTLFCVTAAAACYRADAALESWVRFDEGFEKLAAQTDNHYFGVATSPAFSGDGRVFVSGHEGFFHSRDRGETWAQSDLYHQRINRLLAFSPAFAEDGLVFVGNYGGGPMVWNEREGEWSARAGAIHSLYCGVLTPSPAFADDRTLFYGYNGAWRSEDLGESWTPVVSRGTIVRSLAMSPEFATDDLVLMNRAKAGTFRSTDRGDTWVEVLGLPRDRVNDLAFSPAYPADPTVYATPSNLGVWRSKDGGKSFQALDGALSEESVRALAISPSFAKDGVIMAGTVDHGLFRSEDRGASFVRMDTPAGADDTIESLDFSPDFGADGTVYAASFLDGVLVSTDGGRTFAARNSGLPRAATRVVRVSPDFTRDRTVYVTTHAWLYRSGDGGLSWERVPGFVRVDDPHPTVLRSGTWLRSMGPGDFGGSASTSEAPGSTESYEFFGRRIAWYARTENRGGAAEVAIDGEVVARVDLYSEEQRPSHPVFSRTFDEPAWHVIEVRVLGKKNRKSDGFLVSSDGFVYEF